MWVYSRTTPCFSVMFGIRTKVPGSSIVPNRLKRQDPMSRCVTVSVRREIRGRGCTSLETSFPDAAPGVCIVRYTATNICDFYYESRRRFDSTVGKRLSYRFSRARIWPPGLLFPSKYADYSSASHVFVLHRAAIHYLAPGKTEIYYFPALTTCYLCPAVWFSDFSKSPRETYLGDTPRALIFIKRRAFRGEFMRDGRWFGTHLRSRNTTL